MIQFFVLLLFVTWASLLLRTGVLGFSCSIHPVFRKSGNKPRGEMLHSYRFHPIGKDWKPSHYTPRSPLVFEEVQGKIILKNLDFFRTTESSRTLSMNFQRQAVVYLLLEGSSYRSTEKKTKAFGNWHPLGWFKQTSGPSSIKFGIGHQQGQLKVPLKSFLFVTRGISVSIPSSSTLKARLSTLRLTGKFALLVAEHNGAQVKPPTPPSFVKDPIVPGKKCPQPLHDAWVVQEPDRVDAQVKGKLFKTWHPLIDPCFLCSYGHEHGSAAKEIMGYMPRYGYTTLKNYGREESHAGFKDYVLEAKAYFVYFGVHSHMAEASHFSTRHHTVVIAVVDKARKGIVLEARSKADFGAAVVRNKAKFMIGVTNNQDNLYRNRKTKFRRVVNIVNPSRLNPSLYYRQEEGRIREGVYEKWSTSPFCASSENSHGGLEIDIKNPYLAMKAMVDSDGDISKDTTTLGKVRNAPGSEPKFEPNTSQRRSLKFKNLTISTSSCFPNSKSSPHGFFYTDPYAQKKFDAPGANRIRQFALRGIEIELEDGEYDLADEWTGLYATTGKGEFQNIGLNIKEDLN